MTFYLDFEINLIQQIFFSFLSRSPFEMLIEITQIVLGLKNIELGFGIYVRKCRAIINLYFFHTDAT